MEALVEPAFAENNEEGEEEDQEEHGYDSDYRDYFLITKLHAVTALIIIILEISARTMPPRIMTTPSLLHMSMRL